MNHIQTQNIVKQSLESIGIFNDDNIENVKDKSLDFEMLGKLHKALISFKNGYALSVITGYGAYSDEDTFEIAVLGKDGTFTQDLLDEEDRGDDVVGYCPVSKVKYYIEKVGNYRGD